jgi:proline dehydrogenase
MDFLKRSIVRFVKILPKSIVFIFAKQYIAGIKLEDAVRVSKNLNSKGILTTIDVLGESVHIEKEAIKAKDQAIKVLEAIEDNQLAGNLSIKPTQLGMLINDELNYQLVKEIVARAEVLKNFVRIDMEDSSVTEKTIALYRRLKNEFPNVGIVVQAYLRRTMDDVVKLNKENSHYRICKGIYVEPEKIAYKDKNEIRRNFLLILEKMFSDDQYVGIATHDEYLIEQSKELINKMNIKKDRYEFQMLYGVREHLRDRINKEGHKIRVYVPFGEHWYAYSMRRLQENPALAWYITKSIFTRR